MKIITISFTLFLALLAIHILLWRATKPKGDMKALWIVFMIAPSLLMIFCLLLNTANFYQYPWLTFSESVSVWLLVVALGSAYVQCYPAAQALSPSLVMLLLVAKNMPEATTQQEIENYFSQQNLLRSRLEDLLNSGLATKKDNTFYITRSGRNLIRFFLIYRKILGLKYSGG